MRHSFNHVVTALVPELLGKDALSNETAEMERRALEEAERTSPRSVDLVLVGVVHVTMGAVDQEP